VTAALAQVATEGRYARPRFSDSGEMRIVAGRHPVVERLTEREAVRFIPTISSWMRNQAASPSSRGPTWAEIHLSAAGRPDRDHGADGVLRSRRIGRAGDHRPRIHAHRSFRQPGPGALHVMVEMTETAVILNTATAGA